MFVALTGTPGSGKTTVGEILTERGLQVISLTDIEKKCVVGHDTKRGCHIYDLPQMDACLQHGTRIPPRMPVIVEGHLSHLLSPIKKIIILRCHPDELKKRLQKKGWPSPKIQENLEAEALDIILCEAARSHPPGDIREIDTTRAEPLEVAGLIYTQVHEGFQGEMGKINWSDWLEKHVG